MRDPVDVKASLPRLVEIGDRLFTDMNPQPIEETPKPEMPKMVFKPACAGHNSITVNGFESDYS